MYCTNCGTADQSSKTYCRKCGKWIGSGAPEERLSVMIIFNALSALFGAASAIALWVTYLGSASARWSIYVAATFCIIISVYQTLSFFFALDLRRRLKQGKTLRYIDEARGTNELKAADPADFIPISTVTENTTELLERKPQ